MKDDIGKIIIFLKTTTFSSNVPYTYPPNYMDVIGKLYSNKHVKGFKYGLIREKYPLLEDIILVNGAQGRNRIYILTYCFKVIYCIKVSENTNLNANIFCR